MKIEIDTDLPKRVSAKREALLSCWIEVIEHFRNVGTSKTRNKRTQILI